MIKSRSKFLSQSWIQDCVFICIFIYTPWENLWYNFLLLLLMLPLLLMMITMCFYFAMHMFEHCYFKSKYWHFVLYHIYPCKCNFLCVYIWRSKIMTVTRKDEWETYTNFLNKVDSSYFIDFWQIPHRIIVKIMN